LDQQQGFVLTRHWRDTPQGTQVEFWLATDDGPRLAQLPHQTSVAFFPADCHEQVASLLHGERDVELRALDLRDFQHQPVMGLYCRQHHQLLRAEISRDAPQPADAVWRKKKPPPWPISRSSSGQIVPIDGDSQSAS
jgi:hypothetical protein